MLKSGRRETLAEAADAVSTVVNSSFRFPDAAYEVLIVEKESVEEDLSRNLRNFMSKKDRGHSVFRGFKNFVQLLVCRSLLMFPVTKR